LVSRHTFEEGLRLALNMAEAKDAWGEEEIDEEVLTMSTDEIRQRTKFIEDQSR